MRGMKQSFPLFGLPKHRQHDGIKENKQRRTFRQPPEPEKNPRHSPGQPWRTFLRPPAQPKNDGERAKRYVKRFDLDEASFFDHAEVGQPDQSGDCRSSAPKTFTRDENERESNRQQTKG